MTTKKTPARVDLSEYARQLVADWPPLTEAQAATLRVLLNPRPTPAPTARGDWDE